MKWQQKSQKKSSAASAVELSKENEFLQREVAQLTEKLANSGIFLHVFLRFSRNF